MTEREGSDRKLRVLGVLAHPDDECIFGWPVFQNPALEKALIVVVSDRDNPERRWCGRRGEALEGVCQRYGIRMTCLHYNSEFYRLPYRRAEVVLNDLYATATRRIAEEIESFRPDFVFCHNPHGEYGMFDHRIVFDIVYHHSKVEHVCISDLCETHAGWPSFAEIPAREWRLYYQDRPTVAVTLDRDFYRTCKGIYEGLGCWTWKTAEENAPGKCRLYLLGAEEGSQRAAEFRRLGADVPKDGISNG